MAPERQGRAFHAPRQPSPLQMVMEPAQTVDVDRTVVHPHALQRAGGSGRPLEAEVGLVIQIEYVAHFLKFLFACRGAEFVGVNAFVSREFTVWRRVLPCRACTR